MATVYLTIDGRDVANLAGDGNHAPFHNPPVNFAFTFGGVAGDNPSRRARRTPTATETNFNFPGNDFGGLGFRHRHRQETLPSPERRSSRWTSL